MNDSTPRRALGRPHKNPVDPTTIDGRIHSALRASNSFTPFCRLLGLSHNSVSGTWFRHAKLERRCIADSSVFEPHKVVAALRGVAASLDASARSYANLAQRIQGTWGIRLNHDRDLDVDILDTLHAHSDLRCVAELVGYKVASSLRYYLLRRSLVSEPRAPVTGNSTYVTPERIKAALETLSQQYADHANRVNTVANQLDKHNKDAP